LGERVVEQGGQAEVRPQRGPVRGGLTDRGVDDLEHDLGVTWQQRVEADAQALVGRGDVAHPDPAVHVGLVSITQTVKFFNTPFGPPSVLAPALAASAAPTVDIAWCAVWVRARGPLGVKLTIRGVRPVTFPACSSRVAEPP